MEHANRVTEGMRPCSTCPLLFEDRQPFTAERAYEINDEVQRQLNGEPTPVNNQSINTLQCASYIAMRLCLHFGGPKPASPFKRPERPVDRLDLRQNPYL